CLASSRLLISRPRGAGHYSCDAANALELRDFTTQLLDARAQIRDLGRARSRHTADAVVFGLQAPTAVALLGDVAAEQFTGLRIDRRVVEEAAERILALFVAGALATLQARNLVRVGHRGRLRTRDQSVEILEHLIGLLLADGKAELAHALREGHRMLT